MASAPGNASAVVAGSMQRAVSESPHASATQLVDEDALLLVAAMEATASTTTGEPPPLQWRRSVGSATVGATRNTPEIITDGTSQPGVRHRRAKTDSPITESNHLKSYSATDLVSLADTNDSGLHSPGAISALLADSSDPKPKRRPHGRAPYNERRFHALFRNIPATEALLSRFTCAFVADMGLLIQGHLYVSYNYICFYSNIFGIEKFIEVPILDVKAITKERTALFIPNAVGIRTHDGKVYVFGSLMSRDNTHQLLLGIVHRARRVSVAGPYGDVGYAEETGAVVDEDSLGVLDEVDDEDDSSASSSDDEGPVFDADTQAREVARRLSTSSGRCALLRAALAWFYSLPLFMMLLVVAVVVLILLLLCATAMTLQLTYMLRTRFAPPPSGDSLPPLMAHDALLSSSLAKLRASVHQAVLATREIQRSMETLRVEMTASSGDHW